MDFAISIRTFVCRRDRVSWTSGAGIVADSVPEREADETEHKARALAVAVARTRGGG
jgi:anthranilate synthase component 1